MNTTFPDLAIFRGSVFHYRRRPQRYRFRQPLLMFFVNTAHLDAVKKLLAPLSWLGIVNWRRQDYLPDKNKTLTESVLQALHECIGVQAAGPVYVLAQPRQFGVSYNPATFYFICDDTNNQAAHLLVEVHNTPWGERFCYAGSYNLHSKMSCSAMQKHHRVSPFNPPSMTYDWQYTQPHQKFYIHMRCRHQDILHFDATLLLHRHPFTRRQLYLSLIRYPFSAISSFVAIYWHAWNLWRKKMPIYHEQFSTPPK